MAINSHLGDVEKNDAGDSSSRSDSIASSQQPLEPYSPREKKLVHVTATSSHTSSSSDDGFKDNDGPEVPDGGWLAWSQVLAAHLINAMTWGYAATFGVYQLYYVETLSLPASQVSWIGSVQTFLTFAVCALSGRLADAGHARITAIVGCTLAVFGTFMTSLATRYWQLFLAQGVCTGLGLGIAFMPAISVTSSYFDANRAFALAVAAVGSSVGSVIFPSVVQFLTPKIGFPWAVRCSAFVALVVCILACAILKPRVTPRASAPWVEWAAFKEVPYAIFTAGSFLNYFAIYFGLFYINSFARNVIGFSTTESVTLLLITNAIGIPTRPVVGWIANRFFGPINVFIVATVFLAVMFFSWAAVASRPAMYVYSALFGVAVSANQGLFVSALASMTPDPAKMGIRFGMVETLSSFATLAGPPTAGAIIDHSGGKYIWAQIWGGSVMAAAALVFCGSRISQSGWRFMVKL